MWAVCGVHDQGWKERDVFGKVRYMNYAGCKRKFKIAEYVQRVEREVAEELAAREARAARREGREGSIA
jgi:deoxyribodipyrimidine photo-lyase